MGLCFSTQRAKRLHPAEAARVHQPNGQFAERLRPTEVKTKRPQSKNDFGF